MRKTGVCFRYWEIFLLEDGGGSQHCLTCRVSYEQAEVSCTQGLCPARTEVCVVPRLVRLNTQALSLIHCHS